MRFHSIPSDGGSFGGSGAFEDDTGDEGSAAAYFYGGMFVSESRDIMRRAAAFLRNVERTNSYQHDPLRGQLTMPASHPSEYPSCEELSEANFQLERAIREYASPDLHMKSMLHLAPTTASKESDGWFLKAWASRAKSIWEHCHAAVLNLAKKHNAKAAEVKAARWMQPDYDPDMER